MGNAGYGNATDDTDKQAGRKPASKEQPGKDRESDKRKMPSAGPHADPALMNPDATPGTGALTPPGANDETDSGTG